MLYNVLVLCNTSILLKSVIGIKIVHSFHVDKLENSMFGWAYQGNAVFSLSH